MATRVLFFSSTRADFWPQEPVLRAALSHPGLDPMLLVTGAHLDATRGATRDEIAIEGLPVLVRGSHPCGRGTAPAGGAGRSGGVGAAGDGPVDGPVAMAAVAAAVLDATAAALHELRPDLLVLLGDRHELLAAALSATVARVPIVHLHGGEHTAGAIDDALRHAVSKLAHVHCVSAPAYADRLLAMGEEPWRIHVTGAPALDRLLAAARGATLDGLAAALDAELRPPVALLTYHPPSLHPERAVAELDAILGALDACGSVIATYPGLDVGADDVLQRLRTWAQRRPGVVLVPSLGARYPAALATVDVVVGNSSSGIMEAPSFGVGVVNVGDRQAGRLRADCVLDVDGELDAVRRAVALALSDGFRARAARTVNPHGDGRAAGCIVDVLAGVPLAGLLEKKAP